MLSPFANADMDNICAMRNGEDVDVLDFITEYMESAIDQLGCERNNILLLSLTLNKSDPTNPSIYLNFASGHWCRHDRNEMIVENELRCVLYDTKPRKILR